MTQLRQAIASEAAPHPIAPYSQGIAWDKLIFISGQIPICPKTQQIPDALEDQTHQVLKNLLAVLDAAGCTSQHVLKTQVYTTVMTQFDVINQIYRQYFTEPYPARAAIGVSQLPKAVLIEIEAIAVRA